MDCVVFLCLFADVSDSSLRPVEELHKDLVGVRHRPRERELWTFWTTWRCLTDSPTARPSNGLRQLTALCEFQDDGWRTNWPTLKPVAQLSLGKPDGMNERTTWASDACSVFEGCRAESLLHRERVPPVAFGSSDRWHRLVYVLGSWATILFLLVWVSTCFKKVP